MAQPPSSSTLKVNVLGYSDQYNRQRATEELDLCRQEMAALHQRLIPVYERIGDQLEKEIEEQEIKCEEQCKRRIEHLYGSFTFNGSCSYFDDPRYQLLQLLKRIEGYHFALGKYYRFAL
jgi:hypothetical protein